MGLEPKNIQKLDKNTIKDNKIAIAKYEGFTPSRLEAIFSLNQHEAIHEVMKYHIGQMMVENTKGNMQFDRCLILPLGWLSDFELEFLLHQCCKQSRIEFIEKAKWQGKDPSRDKISFHASDIELLFSSIDNLSIDQGKLSHLL